MVESVEMYSPNVKESFLAEFGDGTQNTYRRIFVNSHPFEIQSGKDLYNFTAKEISDFLRKLKPLTYASSATNTRIVSSYIYWAVDKGLRGKHGELAVNPLASVDKDWISQFVHANTRLYLTERELQRVEDFCTNYQDSVILRCLFEGIEGHGLNELINLKVPDINAFTNTVLLRDIIGDKISTREVEVSERCIHHMKGALKERQYFKRNGYMESDNGKLMTNRLVQNDYVIRNAMTNTTSVSEPVKKGVIYHRLEVIRNLYGGEYEDGNLVYSAEYLSPRNIVRSGMIWMAKKILDKKRENGEIIELTKDDYRKIAIRYGKNADNIFALTDYLNMDIVNEMYPSGVED